jgi:hypothetical protein
MSLGHMVEGKAGRSLYGSRPHPDELIQVETAQLHPPVLIMSFELFDTDSHAVPPDPLISSRYGRTARALEPRDRWYEPIKKRLILIRINYGASNQ